MRQLVTDLNLHKYYGYTPVCDICGKIYKYADEYDFGQCRGLPFGHYCTPHCNNQLELF